jgi:hypothetical protein
MFFLMTKDWTVVFLLCACLDMFIKTRYTLDKILVKKL